ncbi:MAG: putative Processive diacylglycerol alpha-glucosyltransferase [Promethearchaeota archaeon]|nr:MAG: putative Processive diacylglycerol alpha-glucosyltransferase [Candidatus Lokiarchaeota archaeon]
MNIIYLVNFHIYKNFANIESVGGIEVVTENVINGLKENGHKVWVPQREIKPKWAKDGQVDIVCASSFDPLTFLQLLKYKKKYIKTAAIVQHAHTTYEDLKGNILPDRSIFNHLSRIWIRILYSQAHLLITPTEYSKKLLENIQSSKTYPIYAVTNGVNVEKFKKLEKYRKNFRNYLTKHYHIPSDSKIILNVGLPWKRKRVDLFGDVAKNLPEYYFVWVGPINDNADITKTSELDNVIFTGFYDDIREPYYGSDVLLITSDEENQGIPILESAICELPLVIRDIKVFDWLEHNKSAYKANSSKKLAQGIQKVLSNKEYREKIIKNAKKKVTKYHSFEKTLQKIIGLFKMALKIKEVWERKR